MGRILQRLFVGDLSAYFRSPRYILLSLQSETDASRTGQFSGLCRVGIDFLRAGSFVVSFVLFGRCACRIYDVFLNGKTEVRKTPGSIIISSA